MAETGCGNFLVLPLPLPVELNLLQFLLPVPSTGKVVFGVGNNDLAFDINLCSTLVCKGTSSSLHLIELKGQFKA